MWTVYLKTTETIIQLSDKEDGIEPVIIEDDIPMKTTNPTQLKSISDDNSKVIKVKVNFLNHLKNGNLLCLNI